MSWGLPDHAEFGGEQYEIATDFRDIFQIIEYLQGGEGDDAKSIVPLSLFYEDWESVPHEYREEAAEYLSSFLNCFEQRDAKLRPKLIDWEKDKNMIAAEVNKIVGVEVRSLPYLHWFTFIGYFYAIGDGQLATICSIRKKLGSHEKLEKWERKFYEENRQKIDFDTPDTTGEEMSDEAKDFYRLLDGGGA